MTSYLEKQPRPYPEGRTQYSDRFPRYDDGYGNPQQHSITTPRSVESQSSVTSKAAADINASNRVIERLQDNIFRTHEEGRRRELEELLRQYDTEVAKVRENLYVMKADGRDHLLRDVLDNLEVWESDEFQKIQHAWVGTPGISERFASCKRSWSKIIRVVRPSTELALVNAIQQHTGSQALSDSGLLKGRTLESHADVLNSAYPQPQQSQGQIPGIVNLNIAGADAQAHAKQRSTQELEQDLKLAQTIDIANSQEQRFRSLLQDLNSASVELACQMNQAQKSEQSLQELQETTTQILSQLESQNTAAQNIVTEVKQDRGLSRALLTAAMTLLVCVGIPKLRVLLPFFRQVPIVRSYTKGIERNIRSGERSLVAENLVRERGAYRIAYEMLSELAEMRDDGNILHKLAFGFLGLGKNLGKRVMSLPPPSDTLCDTERWMDRRSGPYGPPQWQKHNTADV